VPVVQVVEQPAHPSNNEFVLQLENPEVQIHVKAAVIVKPVRGQQQHFRTKLEDTVQLISVVER
jgi:hypothetical protein